MSCCKFHNTLHDPITPILFGIWQASEDLLDIAHQVMRITEDAKEPLPLPQRAASHAFKIVSRLAEAFQTVKKTWKNEHDHRSMAYSRIAPDEYMLYK